MQRLHSFSLHEVNVLDPAISFRRHHSVYLVLKVVTSSYVAIDHSRDSFIKTICVPDKSTSAT